MTLIGAGLLAGLVRLQRRQPLQSGLKTAQALTATVRRSAGALGRMLIEGWRHGKATSLGLVSGILAGLVAVTRRPAMSPPAPWPWG